MPAAATTTSPSSSSTWLIRQRKKTPPHDCYSGARSGEAGAATEPPGEARRRQTAGHLPTPGAGHHLAGRRFRRSYCCSWLAAAAAGVGWYARAGYFVGLQGNRITIFQGRPGGLLWFRPTVADATNLTTADVRVAQSGHPLGRTGGAVPDRGPPVRPQPGSREAVRPSRRPPAGPPPTTTTTTKPEPRSTSPTTR